MFRPCTKKFQACCRACTGKIPTLPYLVLAQNFKPTPLPFVCNGSCIVFQDKYGPVGLIHVDAHDDTEPEMCGADIAHGTPFFKAGEEGCLDFKRVVQIGLRGTGYGPGDWDYGKKHVRDNKTCNYKKLKLKAPKC